jgi:DNA-binding NarL/FixJ family response regulator
MKKRIVICESDKSISHTLSVLVSQKMPSCEIKVYDQLIDAYVNLKSDVTNLLIIGNGKDIMGIDSNALEIISAFTQKIPTLFIKNLTAHEIIQSLKSGVIGVLPRNASVLTIGRAIEKAIHNKITVQGKIIEKLVESVRDNQDGLLTKKESLVLKELFNGKSYAEICQYLNVSRGTLSTHINNLYSKLGVHSKLQAVKIGIEKRYITF